MNIGKCLANHFNEHHLSPSTNGVSVLDKETDVLRNLFNQDDPHDVKLVSSQSGLALNEQDMKSIITSLNSKNSSDFDEVFKRMIKLLSAHYHMRLEQAYNMLLHDAHWRSREWKIA